MFENLQEKLSNIFNQITGRGTLSENDVDLALREIRRAFIEADVSLEVVRSFIAKIREQAIGSEIVKSIKPGQMVIKIVHDALIEMLGDEASSIDLNANPPVTIMMVGLQGSGKTTTSAKIAKKLKKLHNKKILLASLDTRRPAAQEQLRQLALQINIDSLEIVKGEDPINIAKRASDTARKNGYDILILDTAGRTHIDEGLMQEMLDIKKISNPHETLLVADSLTGQDAVNLAKNFDDVIDLTGIILTRMDGDGRGGAALSMRAITKKPIKAIAFGEKLEDLEDFHPKRIAERILGMGDIVSLVEKAAANIDKKEAEAIAKKLQEGTFDLNDMRQQILQMQKIGGLSGIMNMLPGMGNMKNQLTNIGMNDDMLKKQLAILSSMTNFEREKPEILKHSRKQRIAKGSGTNAADINKLLKMHRQMSDMMKAMGGKKKGFMQKIMGGLGMSGNNMANISQQLQTLSKTQTSNKLTDMPNLLEQPKDLLNHLTKNNGPKLPGMPFDKNKK